MVNTVRDFMNCHGDESFGYCVVKNATPIVALALATTFVSGMIHQHFSWAVDQREYRQSATARHQWINAWLILGAAAMTAVTIIKSIGALVAAATAGVYVGAIWTATAVALFLNHWVYTQYVSHDGSPIKATRT